MNNKAIEDIFTNQCLQFINVFMRRVPQYLRVLTELMESLKAKAVIMLLIFSGRIKIWEL